MVSNTYNVSHGACILMECNRREIDNEQIKLHKHGIISAGDQY